MVAGSTVGRTNGLSGEQRALCRDSVGSEDRASTKVTNAFLWGKCMPDSKCKSACEGKVGRYVLARGSRGTAC